MKKLFKKHFNLVNSLILVIVIVGIFLRFYRLIPNLIFDGEMGTDYMNVLGILNGTHSWLIGPRTSHEWFFISPISYWIYVFLLVLGNFNPVVVNIFWAVVGSLVLWVCYYYIRKLFEENVALISTFFVAISPAWLEMARASRYNAPAAYLFFPYLYYLKKSIVNKGKSLFILGLILGFSMSFFPSPLLLVPVTVVCFIFYRTLPKVKYLLYGFLGYLIPNITFVIYEIGNRFKITLQLLVWIPYRIVGFFGLYNKNTVNTSILSANFYSIYQFFTETFEGKPGLFSEVLFIILILGTIVWIAKSFKKRMAEMSFILLIINLAVAYIGLFIHGDPPAHYYYVISPIPIILVAYLLVKTFKNVKLLVLWTLVVGVAGISYLLMSNWFFLDKMKQDFKIAPVPYPLQLRVDDEILKDAGGKPFSLARVGAHDQFENNFANNYIYILTVRGAEISDSSALRYTIVEGSNVVIILKNGELLSSYTE